jgi:hypothetical protein
LHRSIAVTPRRCCEMVVVAMFHKATAELIASGQAERALKAACALVMDAGGAVRTV